MSRAAIEGKLRELTDRLRRSREQLAVLDEQLLVFRETADETRLQALVDDRPDSRLESKEAARHAEATGKARDHLAATISELEQARDDLLDRLVREAG